jgi:hypothetical protein
MGGHLSCCIRGQISETGDPQLRGDVVDDLTGNGKGIRQESSQVADGSQLQGKAQLQVRSPVTPNQLPISDIEEEVAFQVRA